VVDELPSGDTGDMVPVALPTTVVGMVPKGFDDIVAVGDIVVVDDVIMVVAGMDAETALGPVDDVGTVGAVMEGDGRGGTAGGGGAGMFEPANVDINDVAGCADSSRYGAVVFVVGVEEEVDVVGAAETGGIVPVVPPTADMEVTGTAGVPGAICAVGVEQVTTVPGVVGSDANGTGASVVSGVPGWVVAENGLGPFSGEVTIAPGVDESPMAVLPMVETCARQAVQPASMMAIVSSECRIGIAPSATV